MAVSKTIIDESPRGSALNAPDNGLFAPLFHMLSHPEDQQALIANLSHHLNSPLNVISGQTHLIRQAIPAENTKLQYRLNTILAAVQSLSGVCADLLDIAEASKTKPVTHTAFYLKEFWDSQAPRVQHQYPLQKFIWQVAPSDLSIQQSPLTGDIQKIQDVLDRLIRLAIVCSDQNEILLKMNGIESGRDTETIQFSLMINDPAPENRGIFDSLANLVSDPLSPMQWSDSSLISAQHIARLLDSEIICINDQTGCSLSFTVRLQRLWNET